MSSSWVSCTDKTLETFQDLFVSLQQLGEVLVFEALLFPIMSERRSWRFQAGDPSTSSGRRRNFTWVCSKGRRSSHLNVIIDFLFLYDFLELLNRCCYVISKRWQICFNAAHRRRLMMTSWRGSNQLFLYLYLFLGLTCTVFGLSVEGPIGEWSHLKGEHRCVLRFP